MEEEHGFSGGGRRVAPVVVLALMIAVVLAGCVALLVGVGMMRLAGERADGGPAPSAHQVVESNGTLSGSESKSPTTHPADRAHSAKPTATVAQPADRATPVGIADAAVEQTTPPPLAPALPAPRATASLLRVDDESAGGWVGRYGKRGYIVAMPGEPKSLPPAVSMSMDGSHLYVWSDITTDRRGLSVPADPRRLSAGQWFAWEHFSIDLDLRGQREDLQVALYLLDWDSDARAQRLEVSDAQTGTILLSRTDDHFRNGRYLILRLSGHVVFRFTKTAGANCTLSGVFLDDLSRAAR